MANDPSDTGVDIVDPKTGQKIRVHTKEGETTEDAVKRVSADHAPHHSPPKPEEVAKVEATAVQGAAPPQLLTPNATPPAVVPPPPEPAVVVPSKPTPSVIVAMPPGLGADGFITRLKAEGYLVADLDAPDSTPGSTPDPYAWRGQDAVSRASQYDAIAKRASEFKGIGLTRHLKPIAGRAKQDVIIVAPSSPTYFSKMSSKPTEAVAGAAAALVGWIEPLLSGELDSASIVSGLEEAEQTIKGLSPATPVRASAVQDRGDRDAERAHSSFYEQQLSSRTGLKF